MCSPSVATHSLNMGVHGQFCIFERYTPVFHNINFSWISFFDFILATTTFFFNL